MNGQDEDSVEPEDGAPTLRPAVVIGAFIGVFGIAVLVAIAFTPDARGRIVNLACGLTLLASAGLFIWGGLRAARAAADSGPG